MPVLTKKLWRTILSTRGQFFSLVAVVAVGITVYIGMSTAYTNLQQAQQRFYTSNNFADYYFQIIKAPDGVARQISSISGVASVTTRIQKDVPIVKANDQKATARLTSYQLPDKNQVNRCQLLSGRMFEKSSDEGGIEVLVDPQYAAANKIRAGDTVTIVAGGRKIPLTVVGTSTSPEFVYPMKDTSTLLPEPNKFGIIIIADNQAEQILNMPGQSNQVLVTLAPGADEIEISRQIQRILEPYGNLASYPRKQQLSHAVLQAKIDGIKTSARTLPFVFLLVAATIQFIVMGRMIKLQRLHIGIMKALGYSSQRIILHYMEYAILISLLGAILGTVLGLMMSALISQVYAQYFNIPGSLGGINPESILNGFLLSLCIGTLSGFIASHSITSIPPAASMHSGSPKTASHLFIERWAPLWVKLSSSWKMSLRSISRNKARFMIIAVGIMFAVGLMVMALFLNDSVNYIMDKHFRQNQKYDYLVRFTGLVPESELLNISRLDGVLKTEPMLEIPVKINFNNLSENDVLTGLPSDLTLKKLEDKNGHALQVPDRGVLISQRTADKMGIRVGDRVEVESMFDLGPTHHKNIRVVGINNQYIGSGSFVSMTDANQLLNESRLVSSAMLKVDPDLAPVIEKVINDIIGVSSLVSLKNEVDSFNQNLASMVFSISIMIFFAVVLGFAIVYNSSTVALSERRHELTVLRVLGFTTSEIAGVMRKEILVQALIGVVLGLPFGRLMAEGLIKSTSNDIFTVPVIVYPMSYLMSALGGLLFILVAHNLAVREIKHLDLVGNMKNED